MANPRDIKLGIKNIILASLRRDGEADKDVLVASISLETGFTEKVILKIMDDLVKVSKITINDNVIKLIEQDQPAGPQ